VEELGPLLLEHCAEALQLGALRLSLPSPLLEHRPKALQLSSLSLGLPGLLLRYRPLDVPFIGNPRQFFLQRLLTHSQIRHFRIGINVLEHQLGVVLPKLALWVYSRVISVLFSREMSLSCCKRKDVGKDTLKLN
jgi:hypothetical protein